MRSPRRRCPTGSSAGCAHRGALPATPNPSSHTRHFATHGLTSGPACAAAPSLSSVDPSALIFVALAVAWAVYLIPKALEHHEEGARTRTVERFSATLRVLARREPVDRRTARLVPAAGSPSTDAKVVTERRRSSSSATLDPAPLTPVQLRARRRAAAKAAKRRLRVVTLILV